MPARIGRRFVHRRGLVAALCLLPVASHAQGSTAEAFLHSIYDPYLDAGFKGQPYWQAGRFFVADLARTIETDMREAKRRGEVPKLDGDPFLDAQDWEIRNLRIAITVDGSKTIGRVTFDNVGEATEIVLDLLQTPAGWRISEIKSPSGSLRALFEK
jgi:hypothetical protein